MSTVGKVIKCQAAVAWESNKPLVLEEIEVDPPSKGEVRVKIIASGVCHSDLSGLNGVIDWQFPGVLGHEGAGIIESVGEGVTSLKEGDHVITTFMPQCRNCRNCKNPNGNLCVATMPGLFSGKMDDGTNRLKCKGKSLNNFLGISSFSEFCVISALKACKINAAAPLEKICLLACGVSTGYGSAINTAKVTPGSSCAVWGLGGIGLAVVMGCKKAGAKRIIGIDINPEKFNNLGKLFGVTEFINPNDHSKPIHEVLAEMTEGGLDFTFECVGHKATIAAALASSHPGCGTTVIVGVPPSDHILDLHPKDLLFGRTLKGSFFGGLKPLDAVPILVDDYMNKKLILDEFITTTKPLSGVNEAFDLMKAGKVIRTVLHIGKA